MPELEVRGVGFAAQANGGNADNIRNVTILTTGTFPLANKTAFNSCNFGLGRWRPSEPITEYVKGISQTGLNLSIHVATCEFHGILDQVTGPSLYRRIWSNYVRRGASDFSAFFGFTDAGYVGRRAYVWIEGNIVCDPVDSAISPFPLYHQDFGQTGTSADVHEGYSIHIRYNVQHAPAILSGGSQGAYNDDLLTASNEAAIYDNIFLVTSPHGTACWNTDGARNWYVQNNLIHRAGASANDFAQGVTVHDDITGENDPPAYNTLAIRNNIISLLSDSAGLTTDSSGNTFVDPRAGITSGDGTSQAQAFRTEDYFTSGTFSRDGSDIMTYTLAGEGDDDKAVSFNAIVNQFVPPGGWGGVSGPSDPANWPTAPVLGEGGGGGGEDPTPPVPPVLPSKALRIAMIA